MSIWEKTFITWFVVLTVVCIGGLATVGNDKAQRIFVFIAWALGLGGVTTGLIYLWS